MVLPYSSSQNSYCLNPKQKLECQMSTICNTLIGQHHHFQIWWKRKVKLLIKPALYSLNLKDGSNLIIHVTKALWKLDSTRHVC